MNGKISRASCQGFWRCRCKVDLLVVDGNSSDGTGQIADELAAKHPEVQVLHETNKSGLGRAYLAGFKWALERSYEFIFEMDGDVSHDPDDVPKFLEAASRQNADLVLGSRYTGGVRVLNWPLKRLLLSRCAGIYVWLVTGMPFTDPTGGYKCFRRRALQAINLDAIKSDGYSFQIEMTHRLWRAGFSVDGSADHLHRTRRRQFQTDAPHHQRGVLDGLAIVAAKRFPAQTPGQSLNICRAIPSKTENVKGNTMKMNLLAGFAVAGLTLLTVPVQAAPKLKVGETGTVVQWPGPGRQNGGVGRFDRQESRTALFLPERFHVRLHEGSLWISRSDG